MTCHISTARFLALGAFLGAQLFLGGCRRDEIAQLHLAGVAEQTRSASDAPGAAVGWITSDTIQVAVSGTRRSGSADPVRETDIFHLASNAKAMLATLLGMAVEDGLLHWDTQIASLLPEVESTMLDAYREVELQDLLAHQSGMIAFDDLADVLAAPVFSGAAMEQRTAFSAWALAQPPAGVRGEHHYSNAGYVVAAAMLERATGKSWDVLLQEQLLGPLSVRGVVAFPAASDRRQPWGHDLDATPPIPTRPEAFVVPQFLEPAGHLSMSVRDYARFVQLHLRALRGRPDLLQASTFEALHRPRTGGHALGWVTVNLNGESAEYHQGSGGAGTFTAIVVMQSQHDRAAVLMINGGTDSEARGSEINDALANGAALLMSFDDRGLLR